MQLGTFTACILVDGKALEEYDVVFESPTEVTCWIPSEEGKLFSVQWKCHEQPRVKATKGSVYADGIDCASSLMHPGTLGVKDTKSISHFRNATAKRDLMFSRVLLSDDDALLDKEIPKEFGQIRLIIKRGEIVEECQRKTSGKKVATAMIGDNKLHEKSKKAMVHCIGFGPETSRGLSSHRLRLFCNDGLTLTFVFKYRPLSVLQANGIVPIPSSGEGSAAQRIDSSERGIGILDGILLEDIKPSELDGYIHNLENQLKRLREVKADYSEDRKPKRIKREEPGERRQPLFAPGEIIDLT